MGLITANDVLMEMELELLESPVLTTLGTTVLGTQFGEVFTPPSTLGMYVGAVLLAGSGATQDVITVAALNAGQVTAAFNHPHAASEPLVGATFWAGQPDHPLFTQNEMSLYLYEAQLDFLLKTRCMFNIADVPISEGVSVYDAPADAIRIERVALDGSELANVQQSELDSLIDHGYGTTCWYQDKLGPGKFAVGPDAPQVGGDYELIYSERSGVITLNGTFLVPDPLVYLIRCAAMARVFSKDGEYRDSRRSSYFQNRYDDGVKFVRRLVETALARVDDSYKVNAQALGGGR